MFTLSMLLVLGAAVVAIVADAPDALADSSGDSPAGDGMGDSDAGAASAQAAEGTEAPSSTIVKDEPAVDTSSLSRSLRAVARERDKWKREAQAAKAAAEGSTEQGDPDDRFQPTQPPAVEGVQYSDAGRLDPMLRGLRYDETDDTVWYKGKWRDPLVAANDMRTGTLAQAHQQSRQAQEVARVAEVGDRLVGSVIADRDKAIKAAFPGLSERALRVPIRTASERMAEALEAEGVDFDDPEHLPEGLDRMVASAIREGIKAAREELAELQSPQAAANALAGETAPLASGGRGGGVGAKPYAELSPEDRKKHEGGIVSRVLAKYGLGR